jgi:phage-related minor tail protein
LFEHQENEEDMAAISAKYAREIADTKIEEAKRAAEEAYKKTQEYLDKERLDQARKDIVDWQQSLADSLTLSIMNLEDYSDSAAAILGNLSAQLIELVPPAALNGLEELGRAMGEGEDASAAMERALSEMAQQILKQLPQMFLQAGLQLIAQGQWALGLGFIAAAGATALMSGYADGAVNKAKEEAGKNAQGGVYDEYGKAAREYAAGGVFTNRIIDSPTHFRFASGSSFAPGLMGEAGPEAIMPLTRGSDGRLGVSALGGQGAVVYVIIQNYTNEEVQTEESSDSSGNQIHKVIIGAVKQSITSGEMDQSMSSRYGLRARGV